MPVLLLLLACRATADRVDRGDASADTNAERPVTLDLPDWRGKHLLVFHTDTLRADALTAYGSVYDTLPALGGRDWLRVDGAFAASSWTLPSTASVLTGLTPQVHDVRFLETGTRSNAPLTSPTFVDSFRDAGYATGLFTGNVLLNEGNGFSTIFDVTVTEQKEAWESNAGVLEVDAEAWVDGLVGTAPFLLWQQAFDPHEPLCPDALDDGAFVATSSVPFDPEDEKEAQRASIEAAYAQASEAEADALDEVIRAFYAEQVLGVDRAGAAFLAHLDAAGVLDDTVIVFTADHGQTLNDRDSGQFGHGNSLGPELVHLPLLISGPGLAGGSSPCLLENEDLLPTLARAMGVGGPAGVDGIALQDGCRAWTRSSLYKPTSSGTVRGYLSVQTVSGQIQLACDQGTLTGFDLAADPTGAVEVDPATLPDAEAGLALLAEFAEDVTQRTGDTVCRVP